MTTSPHTTGELERAMERPDRPLWPRLIRWAVAAVILVPVVWSALGLNVSLDRLLSAPGDILRLLINLAQPELSAEAIQRALPKVMESFFIAWIGTIIGATLSFPLAFLAAKNISSPVVTNPVRQLLNAIRAVPELLVAVALIPVTGVGPWTGTLALGIHSIGTLGKLSSEVIEGIDPGPVEAVAAVGGGPIARMRFAVVPQVMPNILAYWLYRFEINIRASAVLGAIGAGGIGRELISQLRFRNYGRASTVLFLTIFAVLVVDAISARARRRIISGHREPGPVAAFIAAPVWRRGLMVIASAALLAIVVFLAIQLQTDVQLVQFP
ncbi:MAG TPA: phosphonate ABC transporter, permease protein PhnE [Acidimicrobiia bacterium]|nr:phosphonate ABC transporter, permease protein PhnE [Acidimicrobiia bacterium]